MGRGGCFELTAASTEIDWLTVPDDQRIISDEIVEWIAPEVKRMFQEDYLNQVDKENLASASKLLRENSMGV